MEPTQTRYQVKTESFEGPLELLLELIEKRKLFVNEVSLANVTDEYITYIKAVSQRGVTEKEQMLDITSFIIIAATLILIKSRSLLPNIDLTPEEEKEIVNLEDRLALYKVASQAGALIKEHFGKEVLFPRSEKELQIPVFSPHASITLEALSQAAYDVLQAIPKEQPELPKVEIKKVMSIEEMIDTLSERIQKAVSMSFRDFSKANPDMDVKEQKTHMIVSFLAMLELVRQGIIEALQNEEYGEIQMEKQDELAYTEEHHDESSN